MWGQVRLREQVSIESFPPAEFCARALQDSRRNCTLCLLPTDHHIVGGEGGEGGPPPPWMYNCTYYVLAIG